MSLAPEIWGTWPASDLTSAEWEVLDAALTNGGELSLYPGNQGRVVRAGSRHLEEPSDPAARARAVEAFERLWRRGLILYEEGGIYALSGTGFGLARAGPPKAAANVVAVTPRRLLKS